MTLLWDSDDAPDWEEGFQAIEEFDWSKPVLSDQDKNTRQDRPKEQTSAQSTGLPEPERLRERLDVRGSRVLDNQQQTTRCVGRAESGLIQQEYIASIIGKVKNTGSNLPSSSARLSIPPKAVGSANALQNTSRDINVVDGDSKDTEAMDIEAPPATDLQKTSNKPTGVPHETLSLTTPASLRSERQAVAPISRHDMQKDGENAIEGVHTAIPTDQPDIPAGSSQTRNDSIVGLDAYVPSQWKGQLKEDPIKKSTGDEPPRAQQGTLLKDTDKPQSEAKSALTGIEFMNHVTVDRPPQPLEHGTTSDQQNVTSNPQETIMQEMTSSIHRVALNDVEVPSLLKRSTTQTEKATPVPLEPDQMAINSNETTNLPSTTHKRTLGTMQKENSLEVDTRLPATKKAKTAQGVQVTPKTIAINAQVISGHGNHSQAMETVMEDAGYASPDLIQADSDSDSDSESDSDDEIQQNKATVPNPSMQDQIITTSMPVPPSSLLHNLIPTPSTPPTKPLHSAQKTAATTQRRQLSLNEDMNEEHLSDIEGPPAIATQPNTKKRSTPSVKFPPKSSVSAAAARSSTPTKRPSTPPLVGLARTDKSSNIHYRPKHSVSKRELQSLHATPPRERKRRRKSYKSFGDESDVSFATEHEGLDGEVDVDRSSRKKKKVSTGGMNVAPASRRGRIVEVKVKTRHPLDPGYGKRHTRGDTKAAARSSRSNSLLETQRGKNDDDDDDKQDDEQEEEKQDHEDDENLDDDEADEDESMLNSTEIAALEAREDEADESYTPTPTPTHTTTATSTRLKSAKAKASTTTTSASTTTTVSTTSTKSKPETKAKGKRHSETTVLNTTTRSSRSRTSLPLLSNEKNKYGWGAGIGADSDVGSEQEKEKQRVVEPERRKTRRISAQEERDGNVKMRLRGKKAS